MKIGTTDLTSLNRPFLIAEAGSSHGGNQEIAIEMVHAAINAGADAITFQEIFENKLYTSLEELPVAEQPRIGWNCLEECNRVAKTNGLYFSVCVTDLDSLEKAITIGIDFIKIVSYDNTFLPFLEECGKKNLPILMSTGASTLDEIKCAIKTLNLKKNLLLYHTDCGYPTNPEEVNLKRMINLRKTFKIPIGYCDHTSSTHSCIAATVLGAEVIEKHFILNKKSKYVDYEVALEPEILKQLFSNIKITAKLLGDGNFNIPKGDLFRRKNLRRSIALNCDLNANTIIKEEHLTMLRPPVGLGWEQRSLVIGKKTKKSLKKRQIINLNHII